MDIPSPSRGSRSNGNSLPSIHYDDDSPNRRPFGSRPQPYGSDTRSIATGGMSIPGAREPAPPPLPPPRHLDGLGPDGGPEVDLGWQFGNSEYSAFGNSAYGSVNPKSSLFGDRARRDEFEHQAEFDARRRDSTRTVRPSDDDMKPVDRYRLPDEGYSSLSGSSLRNFQLQGEKHLEHDNFRTSCHRYDQSMLSKLDPSRADNSRKALSPHPSLRPLVTSAEQSPTSNNSPERDGIRLKPLSLTDSISSPSRWVDSPDTARSPIFSSRHGSESFMDWRGHSSSVSSLASSVEYHSHGRVGSIKRSESGALFDDGYSVASRSNRGSYDDTEFQAEETSFRNLAIRERSPPPRVGVDWSPQSKQSLKRRASSPPRGAGNQSGELQRRPSAHHLNQRTSAAHRFHPNHSSVSSTSSLPRNGSYASTSGISLAASSMTSISSYDQPSPNRISPSSEMDQDSPYVTSASVGPSPRGSLSRAHQLSLSEAKPVPSARKLSGDGPKMHGSSKLQGMLICECCPKKPKKFDSHEELQLHAMEKQYTCAYCHSRFKNKNEAERHQNSLHLRRHSWSCAALSDYKSAYHSSVSSKPSTPTTGTSPTSALSPPPSLPTTISAHSSNRPACDICGYCGEEFPLPANWDLRFEHLTTVHKFGECNQAKKFFRADHFRQHLKHSHAGTSGKWTNLLENACMKDEPVPEKREVLVGNVPAAAGGATGAMAGSVGVGAGPGMGRRGLSGVEEVGEE